LFLARGFVAPRAGNLFAGALRLRRALDDEAASLRAVARAFCMRPTPTLWEFVATAARSCKKGWLLAKLDA